MGIVAINLNTTGLIGKNIEPRRCTMITTDNLATITTAGYLNNQNRSGIGAILPTDVWEILYSFNEQTQVGIFGIFQVTYSASTGFTLNLWENPGNVLLPVVSGDFANFNGTAGQIKDSGYSPSDAAKTKVVMAGSAVQVGYIAHFVDVSGTIDDTAGNVINPGNIQAGLSGTAGTLISYPATASNGSFIWAAVGNAGNFTATLSPVSTLGQASVYTLPDPGNALARALVGATATPFVSGEFAVASGTGGLMVSSGVAAANLQNKTNIKSASTADIGGGGAGPISVVVAGLTSSSKIVATIASSSNVVAVGKCIATATGFDITFTGDPGAACVVNYVAFVVAQ